MDYAFTVAVIKIEITEEASTLKKLLVQQKDKRRFEIMREWSVFLEIFKVTLLVIFPAQALTPLSSTIYTYLDELTLPGERTAMRRQSPWNSTPEN